MKGVHLQGPKSGKTWRSSSFSRLLIELVPSVINSMATLLLFKSYEDHSLLKSYNGGLWKKHLQVWALNAVFSIVERIEDNSPVALSI